MLIGVVVAVVIGGQYALRRVLQTNEYNVTYSVLKPPTVVVPAYPLPRTGCLDKSGDGICDCMDSNRDLACDPLTQRADSRSVETGPAPGRKTVITENDTGSAEGTIIASEPIYTIGRPRAVPRGSGTAVPRPTPSPGTTMPPPDPVDVQLQ